MIWWNGVLFAVHACCGGQTETMSLTLLYKSTIDNPNGTLK